MDLTNMSQSSSVEKNKKLWAILAYVGPLVIISYLVGKDNSFVKFHIKQALVLLIIEVIIWSGAMIMSPFWIVFKIVKVAVFILSIIGIINVAKNKEKELPLVGQFAKNLKF